MIPLFLCVTELEQPLQSNLLGNIFAVRVIVFHRKWPSLIMLSGFLCCIKIYFYLPKKKKGRELSQISELPEEDRVLHDGVKAIHWLASKNRVLQALQKQYAVAVYHLENTKSSKGDYGVKAKGLLKEMKSESFVKLLDYMIDVTEVLGSLSRKFHNEDLFITDLLVLHALFVYLLLCLSNLIANLVFT